MYCLRSVNRLILVSLRVFLFLFAGTMAVSPASASTFNSFQLATDLLSATADPPIVIDLTGKGTGDHHLFLNSRTSTYLSVDCYDACVSPSSDNIFSHDLNNVLAQWLIGDELIYNILGGGTGIGGLTDKTTYYLASMSPVPVPAAIWLFGTALIGLVGFGKRRKIS